MKESLNSFSKRIGTARPAFPKDKHLPSLPPQVSTAATVASDVPFQLGQPIVTIRRWNRAAESAPMSMPEASIHHYDLPELMENDVRPAGQAPVVQSVSKPQAVDHTAHDHLGHRVP